MRRSSLNLKNFILLTAYVLLILVLVTTMMVCGLYARYTSRGSTADSARAAAFAFVVEDGSADGSAESAYPDLSKIKQPGDRVEYTFTVSNFKGTSVSETALDCTISLQLNGSMPLQCEIVEITDSGETSVLQASTVSETDAVVLPLIKSSPAQTFLPSQSKTYTYKLTVEWPKEENDAKYASGSAAAEVILTVLAQQVD